VTATFIPSPIAIREIMAMIPIAIPKSVSMDRDNRSLMFLNARLKLSLNMFLTYNTILDHDHSFRAFCNFRVMGDDDDRVTIFVN